MNRRLALLACLVALGSAAPCLAATIDTPGLGPVTLYSDNER